MKVYIYISSLSLRDVLTYAKTLGRRDDPSIDLKTLLFPYEISLLDILNDS